MKFRATIMLLLNMSLAQSNMSSPMRVGLNPRIAVTTAILLLLLSSLLAREAHAFQVRPVVGLVADRPTTLCLKRGPFVASSSVWAKKRGNNHDDDDDQEEEPAFQQASPLLQATSRTLRHVSFFSWWSQVILTTVSAVILAFTRNVLGGAAQRQAAVSVSDPSLFLSGMGILVSGVSILWTWGNGARLSRRLTRRPVSRIQAAHMLRRAVRVGIILNLVGLLVHLVAAEEIVGTLAIRVLTSSRQLQGSGGFFSTMEGLQPLDVLIVQANTNSLLSHFCSLVALLYLTGEIVKLDPPSTQESTRQRFTDK